MKTDQIIFFLFIFFFYSMLGASVIVMGDLSHEYTLKPGETAEGQIELRNQGQTQQQMRVYQTDYQYTADGASIYGEAGEMARSNAAWIKISPRQLVVPPEDNAFINYTVTAPADTGLGSYWSMIMVEPVQEITPEVTDEMIQIKTVFRYAVQIITHIGNSGIKHLRFLNTQLIRNETGRFLQLDLENNGDRLVRPKIWMEMFTETGVFKGKFETKQGKLLPGASIRRHIDISALQPDTYKTLIIADCGDEDIFGMNLTLKIEQDSTESE